MLLLDTFFYLFLGLYLDAVLPSQYGVAKKWYFVCTKSFWCGAKKRVRRATINESANLLEDDEQAKNSHDFEPVSANVKRQEENNECLKIMGLRK
jgi:hypothetical protein